MAQAEVAQEEGKGEPSGSTSRLTHEAQLVRNLLFGEKINSIHPHKIWIHIATNDFLIKSSAINLVLNMTVCEKMQLQVPGSSAARQRLIEVGGISQKQLSAVQFDWYQFRPFTPRTMLPLKKQPIAHTNKGTKGTVAFPLMFSQNLFAAFTQRPCCAKISTPQQASIPKVLWDFGVFPQGIVKFWKAPQ